MPRGRRADRRNLSSSRRLLAKAPRLSARHRGVFTYGAGPRFACGPLRPASGSDLAAPNGMVRQISDLHRKWMKNPAYRKEYEALEEEFALIAEIAKARRLEPNAARQAHADDA
jgi:hypothetical protein